MAAWQPRVNEIMITFRDALRSIVPAAERARLPWREAEAYDDWDNLAQALYEAFVVRIVESTPRASGAQRLPRYAQIPSTYKELSRIRVISPDHPDLVFFGFATASKPFDLTRCTRLSGRPSAPLIAVPTADAEFRLEVVFGADRDPIVLDVLDVQL